MKKHLISFVIASLGLALFALVANAKQVSVDVVDEGVKTIKAEVVNIQAGTEIDIKAEFSANDKAVAKQGLNLTVKEGEAVDTVLAGGTIDYKDRGAYISALNKIQKEKKLHSDENKLLFGLNGTKVDLNDSAKYLARKRVKENQ